MELLQGLWNPTSRVSYRIPLHKLFVRLILRQFPRCMVIFREVWKLFREVILLISSFGARQDWNWGYRTILLDHWVRYKGKWMSLEPLKLLEFYYSNWVLNLKLLARKVGIYANLSLDYPHVFWLSEVIIRVPLVSGGQIHQGSNPNPHPVQPSNGGGCIRVAMEVNNLWTT